jgi:hypothetical protein
MEHTHEERATLQALDLGVCGQVAVGMHDVTLFQRHCVLMPNPTAAASRQEAFLAAALCAGSWQRIHGLWMLLLQFCSLLRAQAGCRHSVRDFL